MKRKEKKDLKIPFSYFRTGITNKERIKTFKFSDSIAKSETKDEQIKAINRGEKFNYEKEFEKNKIKNRKIFGDTLNNKSDDNKYNN